MGPRGESRAGNDGREMERTDGCGRRGCSQLAEQNGDAKPTTRTARGRPSVLHNSPDTKGKDALTDGRRLATKESRGRNASVKAAESAGEAREDFDCVPLVPSPPPVWGGSPSSLRIF